MKRTWLTLTISAVACVAIVGAVCVAIGFVASRDGWSARNRVIAQSYTPEEVFVVVKAQADGSLAVTETLVFDVPTGSDEPLLWSVGGTRIGWESREDRTQFAVVPTVTEIAAVELIDDSEAAATQAGEALAVAVRDTYEPKSGDEIDSSVTYSLAPASEWSPGRHAVEITYVLGGVHIEVKGQELIVLPLSFASGPGDAVSYQHIDAGAGNALSCLPDNVDFERRPACSGLDRVAGSDARGPHDEPSQLSWRQSITTSVSAVAFAAPENVVADPQPVRVRR